jgi:hypothetical protein
MIVYNNIIYQHIPKTAGTALKRLFSFFPEKIEYASMHSPISALECDYMRRYKDLKTVCSLRRADSWYKSWVDFTKDKPNQDPLTMMLWKNSKDENTFINNALDLTEYFTKYPELINKLKSSIIRDVKNHMIKFITNQKDLSPVFFEHQSLYGFYVKRQITKDTKIFRFETELDDLVRYFGFDPKELGQKLPKVNITKYNDWEISEENRKRIDEKDKFINDLWDNK